MTPPGLAWVTSLGLLPGRRVQAPTIYRCHRRRQMASPPCSMPCDGQRGHAAPAKMKPDTVDTPARYDYKFHPVAHPDAIVAGDKFRFTILTDGLLRYEWAEDGIFEDRASTFAVNRELKVPDYYTWDRGYV